MVSKISKQEVADTILDAIREYNSISEVNQIHLSDDKHITLYGSDSNLDSLGLVSIILKTEELMQSRFGVNLILADDRAISAKNSPFRSVESLVEYILNLIEM